MKTVHRNYLTIAILTLLGISLGVSVYNRHWVRPALDKAGWERDQAKKAYQEKSAHLEEALKTLGTNKVKYESDLENERLKREESEMRAAKIDDERKILASQKRELLARLAAVPQEVEAKPLPEVESGIRVNLTTLFPGSTPVFNALETDEPTAKLILRATEEDILQRSVIQLQEDDLAKASQEVAEAISQKTSLENVAASHEKRVSELEDGLKKCTQTKVDGDNYIAKLEAEAKKRKRRDFVQRFVPGLGPFVGVSQEGPTYGIGVVWKIF